MSQHQNIELARELVAYFLEDVAAVGFGNDTVFELLDAIGVFLPMPGNSLSSTKASLRAVICYASEPVPLPTSGRNKEIRYIRACRQRWGCMLFARAALAMLSTDNIEVVQA
jgi:hypothetical protein